MNMDNVIQPIYLVSAALFILSLMWMNHPSTARRGVVCRRGGHGGGDRRHAAAAGNPQLHTGSSSPWWSGFILGVPLAMVPLTAVPQRTALSHAFGGLAAGLVGAAEYLSVDHRHIASTLTQVRHRRPGGRGDPGLPDLHRQLDGRRQAHGNHSHPADHSTRARTRSTCRCSASPFWPACCW